MAVSKQSPKKRKFQIEQKRKKRKKIKKLIEKYQKAHSNEEKEKIKEKILKIAPHYPLEKLLADNKKS